MVPILAREFYGILRTPRALAAIVAMSLAFALLVLARWPSEALVDLSGGQSRQVFRVFSLGLFAGVLLLAPAFPAASIVREKIKGTLALLFNSPVTSLEIYSGKFLGVLAFTAILLSTSLPAAAACYAMGGIDLVGDVGTLYLILTVVAIECVALGLLVSARTQSPDSAVRITYACVFLYCFASLGPYYLFQGQEGMLAEAAYWVRRLSPLPVLLELIGQGSMGSAGLMETRSGLGEFLGVSFLAIAGLMAATLQQLNYKIFDRSRSQGLITDDQSTAVQAARRVFFLVDPQRRKAGIPFYLNPVMVKEFRTRRFGRFHWLLRLVAICAVLSLALTFAATTGTMDWGVETVGGLLVLFQVLLVALITPSLAAGLISTERESGGWDLLRMTTMSGLRIVTGKLASVAWTLLLILFATAPGYVVMIYIKPSMWLQVSLVMACLALTAIYTLALSAAVGAWFHRTATSTVTVYVVLLAVFLGPLLIWLGREAPFGFEVVQTALMINPMGAALSVIETPGFAQYELIPGSWWVGGVVSVVAFASLGFRVWRLLRPL
jgi:ABC-type transport system involved in multi-copper enzyme maturation permease subunit